MRCARGAVLVLAALAFGCKTSSSPDGGGGGPDGSVTTDGGGGTDSGVSLPLPALTGTLVDHTFHVAEHMRASREMQVSGEPFAQILGYNLNNFNRQDIVTDQYLDPITGQYRTDPLGYMLAIETYEYSKQPMNNLSFESGAGLSLMYGPVLNPTNLTGDPAYRLLSDRFQQFAAESFSGGAAGSNFITSPPPSGNPLNFYGWPGWWPQFAEFSSFDPSISPNPGAVNTCTFKGSVGSFGYGSSSPHGTLIANYECDYNSLNLPNRAGQVSMTLEPDALGSVVWKQGLWCINYWQTMQDTGGNGITNVSPVDMPQVGQPGNTVVGQYPDPTDPTGQRMLSGSPGVYLGDIPLEGWQGLTMMEEIDNKAALILDSLLSPDGTTLTGAGSIANAINYDYTSTLLYFPQTINVTETATAPVDAGLENKYFPQPTGFAIADGDSHLAALTELAGGFGEAFTFTDQNNSQVGGSVPFLATFDGDPFPMDDQKADGENTLHDRALGVIKIALVDMDRIHFDPTNNVLVDTATVSAGGTVTRGTTVSAVEAAAAIVGLRNAYRAMNGSLQLYSNDTPDTLGAPSALDNVSTNGASYTGTIASHIITLIGNEADFIANKLVDANGAVANSYDLSSGTPDSSPTDLASEAAVIRGLLDAYLATSNGTYRAKATLVYADLQKRFWMNDIMAFRTTVGQDSPMQYTPARHGYLQGALRQYYKLVAMQPGNAGQIPGLLAEIKRSNKLVLNGWNDRNQDDKIQYPDECLSSKPGIGLEMGERALTGELGHPQDLGDRDSDCIREISYGGLPAALGAELDISR